MTPEQLKASILQYAIQGKLVPQDSSEGTGEELYQQIQEEKQHLIKEGKIKKGKPLAEIAEDEIPFDIPESWKWVRLSQIIDVRDGTHDSPKYVPEGIPLVTSKNLSVGTIDYENIKYITQADADKINERSAVDDGDILFAMIGSIGNPVLVKKDREFCIKNMALFKRYKNTELYMKYMYWFFYYVQYALKSEASGGVQSFIPLKRFREYIIPLPPLAEQQRIVAKIEELLPYVDRYAAAYEKLEQFNARFPKDMKKSVLQYAIQGKLVPQDPSEGTGEELYRQIQEEKQRLIKEGKLKKGKPLAEIAEDEIPFDIPESWKWVRLQDIGELSRGRSQHRPRNDSVLYEGGGIPFIQTGDIAQTNYQITTWTTEYNQNGLAQSRLWPRGTLCLTIAANIGDVAILNFDACFPDSVVGFNAYKPIISNEYFLYGLMCYKTILDKMSYSTAQKNINIEILSKIAFPLPPLAEQHRIVAKLEEILPLCDRLK